MRNVQQFIKIFMFFFLCWSLRSLNILFSGEEMVSYPAKLGQALVMYDDLSNFAGYLSNGVLPSDSGLIF